MVQKTSRYSILVNVTILVLLFYLILSLERGRYANCAGIFSQEAWIPAESVTISKNTSPAVEESKDKSVDEILPKPSVVERVDSAPPPTTRRKPPQPSCVVPGKRARSFLMVFSGHSGSTAIMSELRGHSEVIVEKYEPVDHQPVFNSTAALQIARGLFDRALSQGKVAGFKIRPDHIRAAPAKWRALAEEYDTRIVWQYRKNLFKASVGEYTNRYLNDSSVIEGFMAKISEEERCKIGAGCKFRVDDMDFLNEILGSGISSQRQVTNAMQAITGGKDCVRELTYEDYLYERDAALADLQEFLGLKWEKTKPARFKATKDSLCELVENWKDLCKNFYGCLEWQHQLDDPRNGCFCSLAGAPSKYCSSE